MTDLGTASTYGCDLCGRTWVWRNTVEGERNADQTLRAHAQMHQDQYRNDEIDYELWRRNDDY